MMQPIKKNSYLLLAAAFLFAATENTFAQMRPALHFTPEKNWTNDPNGLVYHRGKYHLFYQYNPFGMKWGHMSWGHAVSKDLIRWEHLPVALQEYKNDDGTHTMFFSGTAVADKNNTAGFALKKGQTPLIAIYTAHTDSAGHGIGQRQSMAYSLDGITFKRYEKNPLIDLGTKDFRDPKVFWHEPSNQWIMLVAQPLDFLLQLYGSPNLREWKLLSTFGNIGDKSKIWECPDIFELPVENEPGVKKWIVTLSGGHPQQNNYLAMQYFTGRFDGKQFIADQQEYPLYLDHGKDYYAGIIFNNMPAADPRKIMVGWANCWEYANDIPADTFRGQMAIPREIFLYKDTNGAYKLRTLPVKELNAYRKKLLLNAPHLEVNGTKQLNMVNENVLDISFILDPKQAEKAGISVLKHGDNETMIYYNKKDNTLKIDRTNSGNVSFSKKFPGIESVPLPDVKDGIPIRILADKNIVEVFVNNGRQVMTDLVFPLSGNCTAAFFTEGGGAVFRNVKIWRMKK